jgi:DNA-binding MarR family transcriptional regulator
MQSMPTSPRVTAATLDLVSADNRKVSGPLALFTTLARTGLHLDALQRECLSPHGLAFTEFSVLRLLQRTPRRRLAPSFLAESIVCTTGAMTKLVDRLQRAGFVSREPDPKDRRGVLVRLEPAGSRVANEAAASYRIGRERVLGRLKGREPESIHKGLERLLEVLESDRSEG